MNSRYAELKEKHSKEFNQFPMRFAFDDKQFKKAMEELGLNENDTDKVTSIGYGGLIRKTDVEAYIEMCERHNNEIQNEIENDKTGEGFIKDMFLYELNNHEYIETYDILDTLEALNLTENDILNNKNLETGLRLAKEEYLKLIEESEEEI